MTPSTVYAARDGKQFSGPCCLVVVTCPTCFIKHAIPRELNEAAQEWSDNGKGDRYWRICCPLGHSWSYDGDSIKDRNAQLVAQLDQTKAELRAQKAAATRAKKRAANGVCPCCNRTFKQLARHMVGQHPEYVAEAKS